MCPALYFLSFLDYQVFAQKVPNRSALSLLPAIEHLAAPGAKVSTDAFSSYKPLGQSVRPDLRHAVVNHSAKQGSKFVQKGVHTNHVEGMNSVLKRSTRRRFWQVMPRGSAGAHLQLSVFIENCTLPKKKYDPLSRLLCAFVLMRKTDPSACKW